MSHFDVRLDCHYQGYLRRDTFIRLPFLWDSGERMAVSNYSCKAQKERGGRSSPAGMSTDSLTCRLRHNAGSNLEDLDLERKVWLRVLFPQSDPHAAGHGDHLLSSERLQHLVLGGWGGSTALSKTLSPRQKGSGAESRQKGLKAIKGEKDQLGSLNVTTGCFFQGKEGIGRQMIGR